VARAGLFSLFHLCAFCVKPPASNLYHRKIAMRVGVIGASGAVGRELVDVLGRRAFPMTSLRLFASARSAGTKIKTPAG
jgi:hypothetical protein